VKEPVAKKNPKDQMGGNRSSKKKYPKKRKKQTKKESEARGPSRKVKAPRCMRKEKKNIKKEALPRKKRG